MPAAVERHGSTNDLWKYAAPIAAGSLGAYLAWRMAVRWTRKFNFRDRIVAITGGSRGLGLILARRLAREGAWLAICARDEGELWRARDDLRARGAVVLAKRCDVRHREQVAGFFTTVRREMGPVDVLINNAGIMQVGPFDTMSQQDFEDAMAVHFWAALHAIEAVLPDMRRRGGGRIINIASVGGQIPVPHMLPYCASKFALVGLSDAIRSELRQEGIYVTTICPGIMRTGSPRNAAFRGQHRKEYAWFSIGASIPILSMSADRAAAKIINAGRYGRAKLTLSLPAKLAVRSVNLAPELAADLIGLADWFLPAPVGLGTAAAVGAESTSAWSPSLLTVLNERAARRNNEVQRTC